MSVRRSLILLTIVALALPVASFGLQSIPAVAPATSEEENLLFHTVGYGDVEVTINAIGSIAADKIARLSLTVPGRVAEILVEEGDAVTAGTPLLRLEDTQARLAYEQAELALEQAELNLQDLLDGPDERDIRIAEANVASAWSAYNAIANAVSADELRAAELRVQQAEEAYIAANRARRVAGGDSEEAIRLLDAKIGEASFNLEIARQQLQQLQTASGPDLNAAAARAAAAEAELERIKAGPTDAEIENAQVAVTQAQMELEQAASQWAKYTLTAPFDGIVAALNVEVGALVSPGMPVVELADIEPLRLTVDVDEIDIRRIREGLPAIVRIDALANLELPATLERISLVGNNVEGIISYPVDVALIEADDRVRAGMTAETEIVVESRENVLVVPNQFVRLERRFNRAYVNQVLLDGSLRETEIELGLQGSEYSEVLSGLRQGDVIALSQSAQPLDFFGG
ncbi:MAG: efflux RND transporter periplasmic adaptor subunit [Chloroflexota bacterium]|nr:MAG: hypothetical protein DIU68_07005 [Chloroflexota bacterium]